MTLIASNLVASKLRYLLEENFTQKKYNFDKINFLKPSILASVIKIIKNSIIYSKSKLIKKVEFKK
jgi:hypothetical protein